MKNYLADTHSLIWYFTRPGRLGSGAAAAFEEVATGSAVLWIPVIVLAELIMVIEVGRIIVDFDAVFHQLQALPNVKIIDFSVERIPVLRTLKQIPDIHDRMIVADALACRAALITRDQNITDAGCMSTIW